MKFLAKAVLHVIFWGIIACGLLAAGQAKCQELTLTSTTRTSTSSRLITGLARDLYKLANDADEGWSICRIDKAECLTDLAETSAENERLLSQSTQILIERITQPVEVEVSAWWVPWVIGASVTVTAVLFTYLGFRLGASTR